MPVLVLIVVVCCFMLSFVSRLSRSSACGYINCKGMMTWCGLSVLDVVLGRSGVNSMKFLWLTIVVLC